MLGIIVWHQENAGVELERLMQELKRMIERLTNFLHAGLVQTISIPNPFRGGRRAHMRAVFLLNQRWRA